jgi:cell division protein YceG involved in septum cleavage
MLDDAPRRVLYSDLKVDNPYNTYRIEGLPPGPINSPGKASILAALYPAQHNYYYFVANGKGGHWFSSTYEDHVKNVRKYRRERARYRAQMRARNSTALLEHKDTSTANAARDRIFKKN